MKQKLRRICVYIKMETSSKIIKKSTVVTEVSSKFETAIKSQLRKNVEGLSITDIPMPEVIKRVVSAIDDRSDVPGEIKTDTEGRLLKEFLEYDGIIKPMIQAFDHFIDIQLVRRIENTSIPFALGVISFENVMIFKPSTVSQSEKKEKRVPIYPYMCRRNRTSYTITLKCSVVFTPKDESRPIEKMVCNLGEIPVMLGSKYCNLCGLNARQLVDKRECQYDPFGYFIIDGAEKVVLQHEKLRYNRPFIFQESNKKSGSGKLEQTVNLNSKKKELNPIICRFTAIPTTDTDTETNITESKVYSSGIRYDAKKSTIVNIYFDLKTKALLIRLDRFQMDTYLNIFYIYDLYGKNSETAKQMILHYVDSKITSQSRIMTFLNRFEVEYKKNTDVISALKGVIRMPAEVEKMTTEKQREYYQEIIGEVLFKQVEGVAYPTKQKRYESKLQMLSIMCAKYSEFLNNLRETNARDSWGNKRVVSAGPAMDHLFNQVWSMMMVNNLISYLSTVTVNQQQTFNLLGAVQQLPSNLIKTTFIDSFTPNQWGISGSIMKENMTDILKNENLLAKYSQLLRVSPDTSDKGRQEQAREVNPSQLGYICPIETPEGKQCGIVKALSIGCYISIPRDENVILRFASQNKLLKIEQNMSYDSAFVLNGKFIGWCQGRTCEAFLKNARQTRKIERDVLIYYEEPRILWVYCDGGRPTRPLLIVNQNTGRLVIDEKNLWTAKFDDLLNSGSVEYIDAQEQEKCVVAQSIWYILERENGLDTLASSTKQRQTDLYPAYQELDRPKYTHCEMDPNAILSVVASIIPMADRSQAPRNVYQVAMGKAALASQSTNSLDRFDTNLKSLVYAAPSVFKTQTYSMLGLDDNPFGETVTVAIMAYGGYNQEDSIIVNGYALERGRFRILRTLTYKSVQSSGKNYVEVMGRPVKKGISNLDSLDEDGVVIPGSRVKQGDCLIGKFKRYYNGDVADASTYVGVGDSGIVERVLKTTSTDSQKIVMVKIREVRIPRAGDKLASRYAQKGTIGIVLPQEDMPQIVTGPSAGISPDIIINPLCFTADTRVALFNGLSRKIASFSEQGCEQVWTIDDKGLVNRHSLGMEKRGKKQIVEVTMLDGRKLRCTPDHKFVSFDRKSVEAKDLVGTEVMMGIQCVEDIVGDDESEWTLESGGMKLDMKTPLNREKTLAYARILGYLLMDGSLMQDKRSKTFIAPVCLGSKVDLNMILQDILILSQKSPKPIYNGGVFIVNLPSEIKNSFAYLEDMSLGRRTTQPAKWPKFLLDPKCPVAVLREFLGGVFGGDGHSPRLNTRKLAPVHFSNAICAEYIETLEKKMQQMCDMLERVGVKGSKILRTRKVNNTCQSYIDRPRLQCEVIVPDTKGFGEKVGFRYCVQKMCRMSVAYSYVLLQDNVRKQADFVFNRTSELFDTSENKVLMKDCLEKAQDELKTNEPILNDYYSLCNMNIIGNRRKSTRKNNLTNFDYDYFPTFEEYTKQLGCFEWFDTKREKINKYINKQEDEFVSSFKMKVVDVRPCGEEEVYDIGVSEHHFFVAENCVVVNCIPSRMTLGKLVEIMTSKVAVMKGETVNATTFRRFNLDEYCESLAHYGYDRYGTETMINGMTGNQFESRIFVGPCYYQALKHHVQDKIQQRARGQVKLTTHQPTAGRTNQGGLKLGEMEKDAIASAGAFACLREKTFDHSDAYKTVFCKKCGTIANVNKVNLDTTCAVCGDKKYGMVSIPYSYKVLSHELMAASLQIKLKLKTKNNEILA